jgi:hypothetical protein
MLLFPDGTARAVAESASEDEEEEEEEEKEEDMRAIPDAYITLSISKHLKLF